VKLSVRVAIADRTIPSNTNSNVSPMNLGRFML
jgi:hypothetical protein